MRKADLSAEARRAKAEGGGRGAVKKAEGGGRRADSVTPEVVPKAESRQPKAGPGRESRRSVLARLAAAAGFAGLGAQGAIVVRSLVPNITYDPPTRVKIGRPESFADGLTFVPDRRVFVARDGKTFRAVSAVCTHLGCTVRAEATEQPDPSDPGGRRQIQVFQLSCPCHGSRYLADGSNLSGPAPGPLPAFRLAIAQDDGQLVVDVGDEVARSFALTLP
jgi:cytochrome b6-f complex iron-sulfur subunit